jgi:outer membrane biosynthesis protein TonB
VSIERRRLTLALLVSLLIHALLLSLTFGGQGLGLPGFAFPWRERRIEAPDLHIVLMPVQLTAARPAATSIKEPLPQASIQQTDAGGSAWTPSVSPAPTLDRTAEAIVPKAKPTARSKSTAQTRPEPDAATGAAPAKATLRTEGSGDATPTTIAGPEVIAMERSDAATLPVPAAPSVPTPVIAAAPSASSPETVTLAPGDAGDAARERVDAEARERAVELAKLDRSEQEARRQAVQLEAARMEAERQEAARREAERVESARLEAERQEAARQAAVQQAAARQEAERQEAARREAERVESARLEAERQEAARQAAIQQAAARQEAERQEAARREAERVESARLEAERQEAARQAAARQEAARQEAARDGAAQVEAARREATLRAIGRQLDEEAARREAASTAAGPPSRLAPSSSGARRGRLFGRTDPNAELILYAEAWARKIQLNMTFDMVRDAAKRPHTQPLVTVAIRSDGSVESLTFVLSSGVAEIDEAIRRIVQSQAPYRAFPPELARDFDVIEIRRTWHFDMAIRLY